MQERLDNLAAISKFYQLYELLQTLLMYCKDYGGAPEPYIKLIEINLAKADAYSDLEALRAFIKALKPDLMRIWLNCNFRFEIERNARSKFKYVEIFGELYNYDDYLESEEMTIWHFIDDLQPTLMLNPMSKDFWTFYEKTAN